MVTIFRRECLNPLLSEAVFSIHAALVEYLRERGSLNPLLSEAVFSISFRRGLRQFRARLNPLLSEAVFSMN